MSAAPAGFWRRLVAWTLDSLVVALAVVAGLQPRLAIAVAAVSDAFHTLAARLAALLLEAFDSARPLPGLLREWLSDPRAAQAAAALNDALGALLLPPLVAFALLSLAYHVAFERSRWQATPGQRAFGLRVVDAGGRRLGVGRTVLRFAAGSLSWMTLNLGHALAAVPPRHLALHDRLSATRVVTAAAPGPLPGWARAWLAVLLLALVAASAWLARAMVQALQRAFEGAF